MSSSSNASLLLTHVSSTTFLSENMAVCFQYSGSFYTFTCFSITNLLLLLPLHASIFCLGVRRRWTQGSAPSHSDTFIYHMVAMETVGNAGCALYCCGVLLGGTMPMMLGVFFFSVSTNGQVSIHILTCVERHLAVVHPIAYVRLRTRAGLRIRRASLACAWLLFLASFGPMSQGFDFIIYQTFLVSVLSLAVVSFCSLSVLCALNRPAPGTQADQTKMRAFHTIMAIWASLALRFGGHLLVISVSSGGLSVSLRCGILLSGVWFCLPSSLVLPLLFLHRAAKVLRRQ